MVWERRHRENTLPKKFVHDRTRSDSKQGHSESRSGVAGAVKEISSSMDLWIVGDFAMVHWPVGAKALGASPKMSITHCISSTQCRQVAVSLRDSSQQPPCDPYALRSVRHVEQDDRRYGRARLGYRQVKGGTPAGALAVPARWLGHFLG